MVKTFKNSMLALSLLSVLMLASFLVTAETVNKNAANKAVTEQSSSQSYTLDQAIDYALANNPDLQVATERINEADAQLGIALSAFYPQISARVGYEQSNNPAQVFSMIVDILLGQLLTCDRIPGWQRTTPEAAGS